MHEAELAEHFCAYFAAQTPGARDVRIDAICRIHGGASRQTYSLDLAYEDDGGTYQKGLILRRDPPDSLIDTERRIEFAALRSVYGHGDLPVPEPLFLETKNEALGAPFFVMGRLENGHACSPFELDALDPHRAEIGRDFFRHLGTIASLPAEHSPLAAQVDIPAVDQCWRRELAYWAQEIRSNAAHPQPVAEAAIRYLEGHPPPPAQRLSVVHGDYRTGNYLHDGQGHINAVLDWEMAHIGDPFEDLAWATDGLWSGNDAERAAGLIPWDEAIAIWQNASGCRFDTAAFEWWSLFAHIKGLGIWLSAARTFAEGKNDDPILAWSGWFTYAAHELMLAGRLAAKFAL